MDDAVQEFKPDLIVISTHPEERSAWLRQDIVAQAKRKYGLPVRHIISQRAGRHIRQLTRPRRVWRAR